MKMCWAVNLHPTSSQPGQPVRPTRLLKSISRGDFGYGPRLPPHYRPPRGTPIIGQHPRRDLRIPGSTPRSEELWHPTRCAYFPEQEADLRRYGLPARTVRAVHSSLNADYRTAIARKPVPRTCPPNTVYTIRISTCPGSPHGRTHSRSSAALPQERYAQTGRLEKLGILATDLRLRPGFPKTSPKSQQPTSSLARELQYQAPGGHLPVRFRVGRATASEPKPLARVFRMESEGPDAQSRPGDFTRPGA